MGSFLQHTGWDVFGAYERRKNLAKALVQLRGAGFKRQEFSILSPEGWTNERQLLPDAQDTAVLYGAVIGGVLGWLTSIGIIGLSGLAPLIVPGALLGLFAGIAFGAFLGGIVHALEAPSKNPHLAKFDSGKTLLSVICENEVRLQRAKQILRDTGATNVQIFASGDTPKYRENNYAGNM